MSKVLKPRRGSTAQNNAMIGEAYEITYDTDKNTIVCRDGKTPGGFPLAKSAELEALAENIDDNVGSIREDTVAAAQLAASMSQGETGSLTLEGVAAEVERKAALDLSNLSAAGRSLAAGLGMPSERYVDLAVGVSGASYTANKSGWIAARGTTTLASGYIHLSLSEPDGISTIAQQEPIGWAVETYIPVRKGSTVRVAYYGVSFSIFRLIYAEGEEA